MRKKYPFFYVYAENFGWKIVFFLFCTSNLASNSQVETIFFFETFFFISYEIIWVIRFLNFVQSAPQNKNYLRMFTIFWPQIPNSTNVENKEFLCRKSALQMNKRLKLNLILHFLWFLKQLLPRVNGSVFVQ